MILLLKILAGLLMGYILMALVGMGYEGFTKGNSSFKEILVFAALTELGIIILGAIFWGLVTFIVS